MGSLVLSNPSTIPHIEGMTVGTLTVDSFARRDASGFKFNIRCTRCGDRWTESYRRIMDGFLHQGCRNTTCRYGRMPERKPISQHEKWMNSPDEPPTPAPAPEPKPAPVIEKVSTDYIRYLAVARRTNPEDIRSYAEFKNFGSFMHKNVMDQVAELEEKYG
jgi:predicted  nucleic acid-binding Zn-ribbon protein